MVLVIDDRLEWTLTHPCVRRPLAVPAACRQHDSQWATLSTAHGADGRCRTYTLCLIRAVHHLLCYIGISPGDRAWLN